MRRALVLLVVLALMAIGLALPAATAASPQGALKAAFNAGFSGGNGAFYAEYMHGGMGGTNSAPNAIWVDDGAIRIVPGFFDQVYCTPDTVFGVWWFIYGDASYRQALADTEMRLWIDGEELEVESTPIKRFVDPQGVFSIDEDGNPVEDPTEWWGSIGVPVYGTLSVGDHIVESLTVFGDGEVFDYTGVNAITVTISDDPADCEWDGEEEVDG
jgi:hypothetical protein